MLTPTRDTGRAGAAGAGRLRAPARRSLAIGYLAVASLALPALTRASGPAFKPAGPIILKSCTWSALSAAIARAGRIDFACSGQIYAPTTISVGSGKKLTLDASGEYVALGSPGQLFTVGSGGFLALNGINMNNIRNVAKSGVAGIDGKDGKGGRNADTGGFGSPPGSSGGPATNAGNAKPGQKGQPIQGGVISISAGGSAVIENSTFSQDAAVGGNGGLGGYGGLGGVGGDGAEWWCKGCAGSATGGIGGPGGSAGNAAAGAAGGSAKGGAIYNAGTLRLVLDSFADDTAQAGTGGYGGVGGGAGPGGDGGTGEYGVSSTTAPTGGPGGNGGAAGIPGQRAGKGAPGANGGSAAGGAIYNTGTLIVAGGSFFGDQAMGGRAGDGGRGGYGGGHAGGNSGKWSDGGSAGYGGFGTTGRGPSGSPAGGAKASNGAPGASGGIGGDALGGAIYSSGTLSLCSTSFTYDSASSGGGGAGGPGGVGGGGGSAGIAINGQNVTWGSPGRGGNGANGANGGANGRAGGGAVYSTSGLRATGVDYTSNSAVAGTAGVAGIAGTGGPGGWAGGVGPSGTTAKPGKAGRQIKSTAPNLWTGGAVGAVRCPIVDSVSPDFGSVAWRTPITITGKFLKGETTITFQPHFGKPVTATDVKCLTDTKCTAVTPSPEAESLITPSLNPVYTDVVAGGPGGMSFTRPEDAFTFHPTSVVQLGDSVAAGEGTLEGWRYDSKTKRWFGGHAATWPGPYPLCHDSGDAYGQAVARALNATFAQFACTGANFWDGIAGQEADGKTVYRPAEFGDWVTKDLNPDYDTARPDVVLVTMGADDIH
ncbi:MAG TPA: hypothetical protein VG815_20095, partial [Chloroflexota bacterium]|nr:hypothetical protein [Chloroflexota bacterium]